MLKRKEFRVAQWTHKQYDLLERAITNGKRISAFRRGTEYVVVPMRLRVISGREAVEATHPTTGDQITLYLDEMDSFEVVK
ncbi:MAG TPA: hypothetical protein VGL17_12035 [Gemmatimonadaceae bacterium]